MSKLTIYHKDNPGVPIGTVEVPQAVVEAARLVREYLTNQPQAILYGLRLATDKDYKNV